MKVVVVFEFDDIKNVNGQDADDLLMRCFDKFDMRRLEDEVGASRVYVYDVSEEDKA
jgi:hypothetical protein